MKVNEWKMVKCFEGQNLLTTCTSSRLYLPTRPPGFDSLEEVVLQLSKYKLRLYLNMAFYMYLSLGNFCLVNLYVFMVRFILE